MNIDWIGAEALGCLGLKQGANGVLVLNSLYGLCLVIVHALLLGEVDKEPSRPMHRGMSSMREPGPIESVHMRYIYI